MKKIRLLIIIIFFMVFSSCNKEETSSSTIESITNINKTQSNIDTNKFIIGRVGNIVDIKLFPFKYSSWLDAFNDEDSMIQIIDELIGDETTLYLMPLEEIEKTSFQDIEVHITNSDGKLYAFCVNEDGTLYYQNYQQNNIIMYKTDPGYSDYEALVKHFTYNFNSSLSDKNKSKFIVGDISNIRNIYLHGIDNSYNSEIISNKDTISEVINKMISKETILQLCSTEESFEIENYFEIEVNISDKILYFYIKDDGTLYYLIYVKYKYGWDFILYKTQSGYSNYEGLIKYLPPIIKRR